MDGILSSSFLLPLGSTFILYLTSLAFYRLLLHPLAKFPGPKLAGLTRYYEAYHDMIQNGQYTFKIAKLHQEYGTLTNYSRSQLRAYGSVQVRLYESVPMSFM